MSMRVALITGANKGIGFAAARLFAMQGFKVLLGARDVARGISAAGRLRAEGGNVRAQHIDLTDARTITAAVAEVERLEGELDVLVNNAAIGLAVQPPSNLAVSELKATLETNLFGAIAVTQAFLPLLRRSRSARIVNVSSALGSVFHLGDSEWVGYRTLSSSYSMSKAALNAYTALLAAELHGSEIKVNAVDPGFTKTDLTSQRGLQTPEEAGHVILKYATLASEGPSGGFFDFKGRVPW